MSKRADIVRWAIDWLLANDDAMTQEMAVRFEQAAREEWGGQEVRVWKTRDGRAGRPAGKPYDHDRAYSDAASTLPTEQVSARHGISRRTIYYLLKRGPK